MGMRRHPHRCVWRRHLSAATFAPPPSQTRPRPDASHPRDGPRAQAFAGHAEDHWINVVTSRAGGAFAEVRRPPAPREPARRAARGRCESARARARAPENSLRARPHDFPASPAIIRSAFTQTTSLAGAPRAALPGPPDRLRRRRRVDDVPPRRRAVKGCVVERPAASRASRSHLGPVPRQRACRASAHTLPYPFHRRPLP